MTDEAPPEETTQGRSDTTAEDARFEVKWRKKSEPAPKAETAPAEATADVAELRAELEKERARANNLYERWQRAAADLVNLRKRTEQEQAEKEKFASMVLVYDLLPALDNFERALATIPGNLAMLTWIQGVMLIQRQVQAILEHQGLAPIEAQGQAFNPALHEAISERETSEAAPGVVVQEYQRGYTMHGRVIRPTLVEVAKAPAAPVEVEAPAPGQERADPATSMADASQDVFVADPEAAEETIEVAEDAETKNVGP